MRLTLAAVLLCTWLATSVAAARAQQTPVDIDDWAEIRQHEQNPQPVFARTGWIEAASLLQQAYGGAWEVRVVVDETGAVGPVEIVSGPEEGRPDAEAAARAMRFRPFERGGRPVSVRFPFYVVAEPQDYSGPPDRRFPESYEPAVVRIRLARTGCFGACPSYEVEIAGDGLVHYRGGDFTLIGGERRWRTSEANVAELIELFRRADYFNLRGYYRIPATDLPTFITGLQIGPRRKFILNYGRSMGQAVASTIMGGGGELAPASVVEIENAIDRLSGADAWAWGNDQTVAALRAQGWNFRSRDSGRALALLARDCKLSAARAFLAEGAPVAIIPRWGRTEGATALNAAPRCGDVEFARDLIKRGAIRNRAAADSFLWASVSSGFPDMVKEALRHSRAVNRQGFEGQTLLMAALDAFMPEEDNPRFAQFDISGVVALLLAASADARAVDDEREGVLHRVDNAGAARALIRAGADPNARNARGQTSLFSKYDAETVRVLIEAGADPDARDAFGRTPMYSVYGAEAAQALIAGGADVNVEDAEGQSPLERERDEDVALVLIGAGARTPDDRARLEKLIQHAREREWERLLPVLLQHSAEPGQAH
jgi:hypothetical protein